MANPQVENGYLRLANELVNALMRQNLSPQESRVLWVILRRTYGFNRKSAPISLSEFSGMTGLCRQNCNRALKHLSEKGMIVTRPGYRGMITYGFQKDYQKWSGSTVTSTGYSEGSNNGVTDGFNKDLMLDCNQNRLQSDCNQYRLQTVTSTGYSEPITPFIYKDNSKDSPNGISIVSNGTPYPKDFLTFWAAYPRKVGKRKAAASWKKLNGDLPPIEALLNILDAQKKSPQWTRDDGQFIPYPATWLNQGRWEDETTTPNESDGWEFN